MNRSTKLSIEDVKRLIEKCLQLSRRLTQETE
jgi:hypothetical protein